MKTKLILFGLFMVLSQLSAQDYNIPHRFVDNYYFRSRDIQVDRNIIYGQSRNYKGRNEILDMDLYYPSTVSDSLSKRPLILLVHGGSNGDNSKTEKYCPLFAQRGFVVSNINRRKGRKSNTEFESFKEAYRSLQDAHAALRFLIKNAQKYGIDTSAIFVGGVSAGSLTAIGISYMDQIDFDNHYPDITEALGRIDNSINDLTTTFTIRGVIDMWGQIPDTSFISREEACNIPMIIFHSTADSSLSNYEKALQLASRYKSLGGCYQLHTSIGTGHVEGISKYYIAEQTGCFLKSILFNSCNSFEIEVDNENIRCINGLTIDSSIIQRSQIKLDASIINHYSGIYNNKGDKIKITSEHSHLFIIDEQNGINYELYPESEKDFYMSNDNIQFSFYENTKGRTSGLTLFIDAKEINFKKKK